MAMPCVYLQRHALELALKDLLGMAYEVAEYCKDSHPGLLPSKGARKRLATSHCLHSLLLDLEAVLARELSAGFSYPSIPQDLRPLVLDLAEIEAGEASRLRYASVSDRSSGVQVPSFPVERTIPVVHLQARLVRVIESLFDSDPCLASELYTDIVGLDSER
jgi:hypothetical protein